MTPEYTKKRDELISSALHQISTRALRDAPVYLEHVSSAKHGIGQAIDRLVEAEASRRERAAQVSTIETLMARCSEVTLRDYGGNKRLLLQVVDAESLANMRLEIMNREALKPADGKGAVVCLDQDDYQECM